MDIIKTTVQRLNIYYPDLVNRFIDCIEKARVTKYFKREGTKGKYKYYYTDKEYNEAKGIKKTAEDKPEKENEKKWNDLLIESVGRSKTFNDFLDGIKRGIVLTHAVDDNAYKVLGVSKENTQEQNIKSLKSFYNSSKKKYKELQKESQKKLLNYSFQDLMEHINKVASEQPETKPEKKEPESENLQSQYNEIKKIANVGQKTAEMLLAYVGSVDEIKKVALKNPKQLTKIPGISENTANKISESIKNSSKQQTTSKVKKILKESKDKEEAVSKIKDLNGFMPKETISEKIKRSAAKSNLDEIKRNGWLRAGGGDEAAKKIVEDINKYTNYKAKSEGSIVKLVNNKAVDKKK